VPEDEAQGEEAQDETAVSVSMEERLAALEGHTAARRRQDVLASVVPAEALNSPVGQFFAANYRGDLTADEVRVEATRIGLLPDPSAQDQAGVASDAERQAHDQSLDLRHGGEPAGSEHSLHPNELAREAAKAARRTGTEAEALGAYIESHAGSILSGDTRKAINIFSGGGAIHR
jgi:hypothetical protein